VSVRIVGKPLRVLIVDDSSDDAALVLRQLTKEGYAPDWERVEQAAPMRAALAKRPWDIVVSDWNMPQFSALGALKVLQEAAPDIPLIIVSGTIGEERAIDALRAGARDFVAKDRLTRLATAIERELADSRRRADHRELQGAFRLS